MVKVNFWFVSSGLSGKFSGVFLNMWSDIFFLSFFRKSTSINQIDNGISHAIRNANKIFYVEK